MISLLSPNGRFPPEAAAQLAVVDEPEDRSRDPLETRRTDHRLVQQAFDGDPARAEQRVAADPACGAPLVEQDRRRHRP